MNKGGFYFIATVLDMQVALPADITPTIRLDRASDTQLEQIKKVLDDNDMWYSQKIEFYEGDLIREKNETGEKFYFNKLPRANWRYFVINFGASNNIEPFRFFSISDLVEPYLTSYVHFYTSEEFGIGKNQGRGYDSIGSRQFYIDPQKNGTIGKFTKTSLEQIINLFRKYTQLDNTKHEGILRAVNYHGNIKRLTNLNDLPVLALFMIIEMLITHNPGDKEIGDSLSHQIKTKIVLLSKRFTVPLDYSVFGNDVKPENIWGGLYSYRSAIAHGGHIDFTSKSLKILKSKEIADDFLTHATRLLLEHAIYEPDLVNDLKPI